MEYDEIVIKQVKGHWEVYVNGRFYCSADTYDEALKEITEFYWLI